MTYEILISLNLSLCKMFVCMFGKVCVCVLVRL